MNVNVSTKKVAIFIAVLVVIALSAKFAKDTAPKRKAKAEYKALVEFAGRQAAEIAVIEQAARLQQLKTAIRKAQTNPSNSTIPKEVTDGNENTDSQ